MTIAPCYYLAPLTDLRAYYSQVFGAILLYLHPFRKDQAVAGNLTPEIFGWEIGVSPLWPTPEMKIPGKNEPCSHSAKYPGCPLACMTYL